MEELNNMEEKAGMQLPIFARVIAIPDPPANGETCKHDRPKYAVNLQLLNSDLQPDPDMPELKEVPVALPSAGQQRGFTGLPQVGTIVEVAFAYGRQDLPFVRSVLPYELSIADTGRTSMRWSHTSKAFQEVDESGNWTRETDVDIEDKSKNHTLTIEQQLQIACDKIASIAQTDQSLKAPKTWIGSDSENVLTILSDFMFTVQTALTTIANHTHPQVGQPDQKDQINTYATAVGTEKGRLDPIKL